MFRKALLNVSAATPLNLSRERLYRIIRSSGDISVPHYARWSGGMLNDVRTGEAQRRYQWVQSDRRQHLMTKRNSCLFGLARMFSSSWTPITHRSRTDWMTYEIFLWARRYSSLFCRRKSSRTNIASMIEATIFNLILGLSSCTSVQASSAANLMTSKYGIPTKWMTVNPRYTTSSPCS